MWFLALLLGCGPGRDGVDWDATTDGDAAEDAAVALFVFGVQETDGALLRAVHPAGSTLRIRALPRGLDSAGGWEARSLDDEVLEITNQTATDDGLDLVLKFRGEGSTSLAVVERGTVLDEEIIEVREAVDAHVYSWEELQRDDARPLGEVHLAEDTDATFAVTWISGDGETMAGGGVLEVDAPAAIAAESGFDGTSEILRLRPPPGSAGTYEVGLVSGAQGEVRRLPVIVHPRSDVTDLDLVESDRGWNALTGARSGTLHAVVAAGPEVLYGADVTFAWDGGSGTGDTITFASSSGPATDVEVCFDDTCHTVWLPAGVESVVDEEASLTDGCGCATGSPGFGWAAVALVALARRRFSGARPSGPSPRCSS